MAEVMRPSYNLERDPVLEEITNIHMTYEKFIRNNPCITRSCCDEAMSLLESMEKYGGAFKKEINFIINDLRDFEDAHSLLL